MISSTQLSLGHNRVHTFQWNHLGELPNIADYDLVVLDTSNLTEESEVDENGFLKAFTPVSFWRVVKPGGKVIVMGNPTFQFKWGGGDVTSWTGLNFSFEACAGDQISLVKSQSADPSYKYFSGLLKYSWLVLEFNIRKDPPSEIEGKKFSLVMKKLAENRARLSIAARISPVLHAGPDPEEEKEDRGLWLLPEYHGPDGDGVSVVLRDFFGIHVKTREPDWVSSVQMPGESEIRERVVTLKEEINQKEAEVGEQEEKLQQLRQPVALLYETGLPLEKAVRNALKSLGGTVTTSSDSGSHDGWVSIDIEGQEYHFVLEVKGYEANSVKEDGLKQLSTWVAEAIAQQFLKPKAVLVVNWARLDPIEERSEGVGENLLKRAELSNVAVLPSEVLFRTLVQVQEGGLEPPIFWKALLECDGLFSLE